jgi:hypothetical protein
VTRPGREVVEAAYAPFAAELPLTVYANLLADVLDFDRHAGRGQLLAECERRSRDSRGRAFAFHTAAFRTEAMALYEGLGYCRAPHFDLDITTYYGHPAARPIMAIAYSRNLGGPSTPVTRR